MINYLEEFNVIKFEDLMTTFEANKEKLSGLNIYAFSVYHAGEKIAVRAYSSSMKSKELVGMEVVRCKEP